LSEELTPTSAAEWRKPREEGYTVTLPSGKIARLRPVALDMLVAAGRIPDTLTAIAAKALWGGDDNDEGDPVESLQDATDYIEFVNLITRAAMLEPRICDQSERADIVREDGERIRTVEDTNCIMLDDIELDDRVMIQRVALLPATQMRRFRDRQIAGMEALSDGESDQPEAE